MFACSDASQQDIEADIRANDLDGLVVASCSPKLHTYTFRGVAQRAGLNPYEYTQVNIREQCSWVHTDDHEGATAKATALVRAGIGRTRNTVPLEPMVVETIPHTLVIGGGIAGLRAAVGLADIGLRVTLVERELVARRLGQAARPDVPARQGRPDAHRGARRRGQAPPVDHGSHRGRGRRQGRQLRQLPDDRPRRRRGRGHDRGRRRLDRRRHRASTATRPGTASSATGSTASSRCPSSRSWWTRANGPARLAGPSGPQRRLRLLRGQPRHGRLREPVLLAVLLRGHRADGRAGVRARPVDPPVPPLPRHADVRQVRAALHRGPRHRVRVPQVRQRRAAGGGRRAPTAG